MDDIRKYFEILGLKPQASLNAVKETYKDLVKVWHPDLFVHNPKLQKKAQKRLQEINEAYFILQNFLPELNENHQSDCSLLNDSRLYENRASQIPTNPRQKNAGFWLRAGAFIVDLVFLAVPVIIFDLIGSQFSGFFGTFLMFILIGWVYYASFEASYLQATLGKRAFGIVVTNYANHKISFKIASLRYLGKLLSGVVLCIGYTMAAFTTQKRTLHDILSQTLVVRKTNLRPSILLFAFFFAVHLLIGTPLYYFYLSKAGHNPFFLLGKFSGFFLIPLGVVVAYNTMKAYNKRIGITSAIVTCLLITLIVFGTSGSDMYDGNNGEYWRSRGMQYYDSGLHQKAIGAFKLAIRIQPDNAKAHCNLGSVLRDLGMHREALEAYQQAIRIQPDNAKAHCNLGSVLRDLGMHREALEAYQQAIRKEPNCAHAHFNLGIIYNDLGEYKKAIEAYKQVIQIEPNDASAHNNLGAAYMNTGMFQEASETHKRAVQIDPVLVEAHFNLGISYLSLNDRSGFLIEYNIVKDLDPQSAKELLSMNYSYSKFRIESQMNRIVKYSRNRS
jgi:tetratricopeptide (TPR) repeat protein